MSISKKQDDTLFCERCGISFLWSVEEQNQRDRANERNAKAPIYCAGCRQLLPADLRERGLVKWYNAQKRYGFITRRRDPELYMHGSQLQDQRRLFPGDLVEFSVGANERGPAAQAIQVLERTQEV
jgi:CspA family cold shock protein